MSRHFSEATSIIRLFEYVLNAVNLVKNCERLLLKPHPQTTTYFRGYKFIVEQQELATCMQFPVTFQDTFKI
jgi:hypothetical protein